MREAQTGRDTGSAGPRPHLAARLAERRGEVETEAYVRIVAVSDPSQIGDPMYMEGLRTALSASFDFAVASLERPGEESVTIPSALLIQARLAAHNGVSLDTVLRRYFAGYTLLSDFLMREGAQFPSAAMQQLMRGLAASFDRLVAAITREHSREWQRRPGSSKERRVKLVEDLLDGQLVGREGLDYDLGLHHLGMVAKGIEGPELIRWLARTFDLRYLLAQPDEEIAWGWLGGDEDEIRNTRAAIAEPFPAKARLAIGEPAQGLAGWRLTHRQAQAALLIASRTGEVKTHYSDVALLASAVKDDLLVASLRELYIEPLSYGTDGGAAVRETLRAYFAAERNVSSTAAALKVSRRTVSNRLRKIETKLNRPLVSVMAALTIALELEALVVKDTQGNTAALDPYA